ncbi:MAG: hypothetical protein HPAVJP_0610 [Candidatus Hepatoplasma vulgare]|nr:MAG: hypothetical protein HPAVJP_0610 [Candidatus Hepatoplasma sp.]
MEIKSQKKILNKNNYENIENEKTNFSAFFILYFRRMCSWKQLLFFIFLFIIIFISVNTFNFFEMYSLIVVTSIILFFIFNYGLFIYNLKKSNIYERIRGENKYQLKNYSSIILNVILLTFFIYGIVIAGAVVDNKVNDFKDYAPNDYLFFNFDLNKINYFWLYYSILLISIIIMSICFFIENITKTIKTFFILMLFIFFVFLIMNLLIIKINFCIPNITYTYSSDNNILYLKEIPNQFYYNFSNSTLNISIGLRYAKADVPYLILAIFYPFFALQSILITSLNSTNLNSDTTTYYINNVLIDTSTLTINEMFLPHIFHWDSTSYVIDPNEPNTKVSYNFYNIYFLLQYFYILMFLLLALFSKGIQNKRFH